MMKEISIVINKHRSDSIKYKNENEGLNAEIKKTKKKLEQKKTKLQSALTEKAKMKNNLDEWKTRFEKIMSEKNDSLNQIQGLEQNIQKEKNSREVEKGKLDLLLNDKQSVIKDFENQVNN